MPDLPSLTLSQAHYDRVVAAFPGATTADKAAAYKAWLTGNLIDYAATAEARRIDEAANAAKAAKLAALAASLPTRPGDVAAPAPEPVPDGAPVLNVKDYDPTTLAPAVAAAPPGTVVWVPAGTFLTDPLAIPTDVHLDGRGTLRLRPQPTGVPVLLHLGVGASVRNISLDFGSGHASTGNVVRVSNDSVVAGCTIHTGVGGQGVVGLGGLSALDALANVFIRGNRFVGIVGSRAAVQVLNFAQGIRVVDNDIDGTVGGIAFYSTVVDSIVDLVVSRNVIRVATPGANSIPIEIQRATRAVVSDNLVDGGTHGLSIGSTDHLTCTGNTVRNQTSYGIEAGGGSHQVYSNNVLTDNAAGMDMTSHKSTRNVTISNNVIRRCSAAVNGDGIRLGNNLSSGVTFSNVSIVGNTFDDILGNGTFIQIFGGAPKTDLLISNNICTIPAGTTGTTPRAIRLQDVTRGVVSSNLISVGVNLDRAQVGAIQVDGTSDHIDVRDNVIHSTTGGVVGSNGILTYGALGPDITVRGNKVTGFRAGFTNKAPGSLNGVTSTVVAGNLISGCTIDYEILPSLA